MTAKRKLGAKERAPSVTDILNESIAEGGLKPLFEWTSDIRFGVNSHPGRVEVEVLGPLALIHDLEREASASAVPNNVSNVIDFSTRKPTTFGNYKSKLEVVYDAAPGRYDSGFAILAFMGARDEAEILARKFEAIVARSK